MKSARISAFRSLLVTFCALLVAGTSANAQKGKVSPLLFCAGYAPGLTSLFAKQADGRYQEITLSTANVIEAADVPVEDGTLSFYGPAGDDGKNPLAATVKLPASAQPLIVLNPAAAEDAKPPYVATVIDADPAKFPLGSYHLVNLSPYPIRVTRDKESFEVPPSGTHIYHPKGDHGEALAITIDYKLEDEWLLLSSSNWANRDDRRTLVCIVEDAASKRMAIKSIPLRPTASNR